jgi:hypothetical protein
MNTHGQAVPQLLSHTSASASPRAPYPTTATPIATAKAIQALASVLDELFEFEWRPRGRPVRPL